MAQHSRRRMVRRARRQRRASFAVASRNTQPGYSCWMTNRSPVRDDITFQVLTRSYSEQNVLDLYHRWFDHSGHRNFSSVLEWVHNAGTPVKLSVKTPFYSAYVQTMRSLFFWERGFI